MRLAFDLIEIVSDLIYSVVHELLIIFLPVLVQRIYRVLFLGHLLLEPIKQALYFTLVIVMFFLYALFEFFLILHHDGCLCLVLFEQLLVPFILAFLSLL